MRARLRNQGSREGGFSLIEILVVIIIIGILAAIAIPLLMSQRKKGIDASLKEDLHTLATKEETYYSDFSAYNVLTNATGTANFGTETVTLSKGNTVSVTLNTAGTAYCILASNPQGSSTPPAGIVYISSQGGIQPLGTTSCPAAGSF
jgi:prepilin-type N-terminal cleavage/methylation domain-containing protein